MARLSQNDQARVKRWLYTNDTVLWALGVSRGDVCMHLGKAGIPINRRQLRRLVSLAPCVRWVGRRRHNKFTFETVSLTAKQWSRLECAVRIEAKALPRRLLNMWTLARSLGDNHALYMHPQAVSASLAYRALVEAGAAPDVFEKCCLGDVPK